MSENWNEVLRNEPIDLSPRPGFEAELRRGLTDEWNGRPILTPTDISESVDRPTRRGWLVGAAAAAVLVIGGVVVATRPGADSTVQTPVSEPEPSPTSRDSVPTTDAVVEPAPETTDDTSTPTALDGATTSTLADSTTTADTAEPASSVAESLDISTTPGTQIGRASTGRTIANPVPWDPGTIYIDDATPEFFELDINPPDPDCIAAEATATIGRGGQILLSVFIDGDHVPGTPCPDESGNNLLPLTIDEPLAGRRIYTDSSVAYGEESAAGEQLSDEVIGLELDEAVAVIDEAGFQSEVIPADPGVRESIFLADRINLYLAADGTVEFARPG